MERKSYEASKIEYGLRIFLLIVADFVTILIAYFLALWIRYDFKFDFIPRTYLTNTLKAAIFAAIVSIIVYTILRLYQSIWRYISVAEMVRIIVAYLILGGVFLGEALLFPYRIPRSVLLMGYVFSGIACVFVRYGYRMLRYVRHADDKQGTAEGAPERVLLIGAGQAAREVLRDIQVTGGGALKVCVIVDDNPTKQNRYLEGVRIAGKRQDIPRLVQEHDISRIIFAITTADPEDRIEILNICKETGCRVQTLPSLGQLISEEVTFSQIRDVEVADLLGRDEIHLNKDEVRESLVGKVVMVTGGGGSIGSELCRQIAMAGPKQLIIFDIYENNAYDIQLELKHQYPDLDLVALIGSVRNTNRVNSVLAKYRPDCIFHAAAHKHVPLMEDSPNEAIKNNSMGTYKLAQAAAEHGVKKFLLISTDKAVNPTNIMGASKRICEMVVQMMNRKYPDTTFMAVRFGNVLGSNGSVIPLFKKQIAGGGPVTVTDPRIIRYFMTIPEAVSLVLQASLLAKGGEIFVLDMGEPVKIDDMARNLIKLSGLKPDVDIRIEYTGLRPGEKLYEELLMDEEGLTDTENHKIHIGKPIEMDDERFRKQLEELDALSREETDRIKEIVAEVVPTYHPANNA